MYEFMCASAFVECGETLEILFLRQFSWKETCEGHLATFKPVASERNVALLQIPSSSSSMEDHEGPGWHLVGSDRESHQGQNAPPCLTPWGRTTSREQTLVS